MTRLCALTLVLVAAGHLGTSAQMRRPPSGSVLIGHVVDATTRKNLDRVVVTVEGVGYRQSIGVDHRGRFLLSDLPGGVFTLTARRTGYLPGQYGQRQAGGSGTDIVVSRGQWLSDLELQLWRPAVVTGDVRDVHGDAMAGVRVTAFRQISRPGLQELDVAATTATDDKGEYRLTDLPAGDYVVGIAPQSEALEAAELTPVFAGGYYPRSDTVSGASVVTLAAGRDFNGINFILQPTLGQQVDGRVDPASIPDGRHDDVMVVLRRESDLLVREPASMRTLAHTTIDLAGRFHFPHVPEGTWVVEASLESAPQWHHDIRQVVVTSRTVEPVVLELRPALSVAGTTSVQLRRGGRVTSPLAGMGITFNLIGGEGDHSVQASTDGSGRFMLEAALVPGRYHVSVDRVPAGLMLQGVMLNGVDVADEGLDLTAGRAPGELTVILTDVLSEIGGTVRRTGPLGDSTSTVIAFPQDSRTVGFRRMRATRVRGDGTYLLTQLPPGAYVLVAIDAANETNWTDPDRLRALRPRGTAVTVGPGQARIVDLRRP